MTFVSSTLDWEYEPHFLDVLALREGVIPILLAVLLEAGIAIPLGWVLWRGEPLRSDMGFGHGARSLRLSLIIVALAIALAPLAPLVQVSLGEAPADAEHFSRVVRSFEPARQIASAAFLILVVPVVEEVYFRGVVLSGLSDAMGTPRAVLGQAAAFGLMHGPSLPNVGAAVVQGLILGTVGATTRQVPATVAVHIAYNALALLA